MTEFERLDRLSGIIRKHCPKIREQNPKSIESFAHHIIKCFENRHLAFSVSDDIEILERLQRDLNSAHAGIKKLSEPTKRVLAHSLTYSETELNSRRIIENDLYLSALLPRFHNRKDFFTSRLDLLKTMHKSVTHILKSKAFRSRARPKPRYDAAIIALACKKIWREEDTSKPPPKRIHHDRAHPLKSFIENVFDEFGIQGRDGHVFSASSALASLENLGGEDAFSLLIEEG